MYSTPHEPLPKEHNPAPGVLKMRRNVRRDNLFMEMNNAVRIYQTPDATAQAALLKALHDPPVIGRFSPVTGPASGGTLVRVWGTRLSAPGHNGTKYRCKFHKRVVEARFVAGGANNGTLECKTPPLAQTLSRDGQCDFSIIMMTNGTEGVHYRATHHRMFKYYQPFFDAPIVLRMSPRSGPVTGGTQVTVWGLHLGDRVRYNCKFGSEYTPAYHFHSRGGLFDEEETVTCAAPNFHEARDVPFTLVIKGLDFKPIVHPKFTFTYYDVPEDMAVAPQAGPMVGGTLVQMTRPGNLRASKVMFQDGAREAYTCRFGGHVIVDAVYDHSTGTLKCLAPPESSMPFSPDAMRGHLSFDADKMGHDVLLLVQTGDGAVRGDISFTPPGATPPPPNTTMVAGEAGGGVLLEEGEGEVEGKAEETLHGGTGEGLQKKGMPAEVPGGVGAAAAAAAAAAAEGAGAGGGHRGGRYSTIVNPDCTPEHCDEPELAPRKPGRTSLGPFQLPKQPRGPAFCEERGGSAMARMVDMFSDALGRIHSRPAGWTAFDAGLFWIEQELLFADGVLQDSAPDIYDSGKGTLRRKECCAVVYNMTCGAVGSIRTRACELGAQALASASGSDYNASAHSPGGARGGAVDAVISGGPSSALPAYLCRMFTDLFRDLEPCDQLLHPATNASARQHNRRNATSNSTHSDAIGIVNSTFCGRDCLGPLSKGTAPAWLQSLHIPANCDAVAGGAIGGGASGDMHRRMRKRPHVFIRAVEVPDKAQGFASMGYMCPAVQVFWVGPGDHLAGAGGDRVCVWDLWSGEPSLRQEYVASAHGGEKSGTFFVSGAEPVFRLGVRQEVVIRYEYRGRQGDGGCKWSDSSGANLTKDLNNVLAYTIFKRNKTGCEPLGQAVAVAANASLSGEMGGGGAKSGSGSGGGGANGSAIVAAANASLSGEMGGGGAKSGSGRGGGGANGSASNTTDSYQKLEANGTAQVNVSEPLNYIKGQANTSRIGPDERCALLDGDQIGPDTALDCATLCDDLDVCLGFNFVSAGGKNNAGVCELRGNVDADKPCFQGGGRTALENKTGSTAYQKTKKRKRTKRNTSTTSANATSTNTAGNATSATNTSMANKTPLISTFDALLNDSAPPLPVKPMHNCPEESIICQVADMEVDVSEDMTVLSVAMLPPGCNSSCLDPFNDDLICVYRATSTRAADPAYVTSFRAAEVLEAGTVIIPKNLVPPDADTIYRVTYEHPLTDPAGFRNKDNASKGFSCRPDMSEVRGISMFRREPPNITACKLEAKFEQERNTSKGVTIVESQLVLKWEDEPSVEAREELGCGPQLRFMACLYSYERGGKGAAAREPAGEPAGEGSGVNGSDSNAPKYHDPPIPGEPADPARLKFRDGYPLWYVGTNTLRLPLDNFKPGTYLFRLEGHPVPKVPKWKDKDWPVTLFECDPAWSVVQTRRLITVRDPGLDCEMVNSPPVKVLVEVSFNRQQYHSTDAFFTYHDRAYYTDHFDCRLNGRPCNAGDPRNTFSFWPDNAPMSGGVLVTVAGLPVDPETEFQDQLTPPPLTLTYDFQSPANCPPRAVTVTPTEADADGGEVITITGLDIKLLTNQPLTCRFGKVYVPATLIKRNSGNSTGNSSHPAGNGDGACTPSIITCVAPPYLDAGPIFEIPAPAGHVVFGVSGIPAGTKMPKFVAKEWDFMTHVFVYKWPKQSSRFNLRISPSLCDRKPRLCARGDMLMVKGSLDDTGFQLKERLNQLAGGILSPYTVHLSWHSGAEERLLSDHEVLANVAGIKSNSTLLVSCRYQCIFGDTKQCADYDRGTIGTTTGRKDRVDYPGDHIFDMNTIPVRTRSPHLRCFAPVNEQSAPVPFSIRIGQLTFDNFTYQEPMFTFMGSSSAKSAPALHVESVLPYSIPPGAPVHIKTGFPKPPIDRAVYVRFGRHTTVMGIYDDSRQTPTMKREGVPGQAIRIPTMPHLPPGRVFVTVSTDGRSFSALAASTTAYDTPFVSYIGPNRGSNVGGNVLRASVSFYRFHPQIGPTSGGTTVTIVGRDYAGGYDYRCKFGGVVVPAVFHFAAGPLATLVWHRRGKKWGPARGVGTGHGGPGRHGTITCQAPPSLSGAGPIPFTFSTNGGKEFTGCNTAGTTRTMGDGESFVYYKNPLPVPVEDEVFFRTSATENCDARRSERRVKERVEQALKALDDGVTALLEEHEEKTATTKGGAPASEQGEDAEVEAEADRLANMTDAHADVDVKNLDKAAPPPMFSDEERQRIDREAVQEASVASEVKAAGTKEQADAARDRPAKGKRPRGPAPPTGDRDDHLHFWPKSGSTDGGTQVVVDGKLLRLVALSLGSSHGHANGPGRYYCSFGRRVMLGLYDAGLGRIRCLVPPGVVGIVQLRISFNKQDFIQLGDFRYYDPYVGVAFSPSSGPTTGVTTVTLTNIMGALTADLRAEQARFKALPGAHAARDDSATVFLQTRRRVRAARVLLRDATERHVAVQEDLKDTARSMHAAEGRLIDRGIGVKDGTSESHAMSLQTQFDDHKSRWKAAKKSLKMTSRSVRTATGHVDDKERAHRSAARRHVARTMIVSFLERGGGGGGGGGRDEKPRSPLKRTYSNAKHGSHGGHDQDIKPFLDLTKDIPLKGSVAKRAEKMVAALLAKVAKGTIPVEGLSDASEAMAAAYLNGRYGTKEGRAPVSCDFGGTIVPAEIVEGDSRTPPPTYRCNAPPSRPGGATFRVHVGDRMVGDSLGEWRDQDNVFEFYDPLAPLTMTPWHSTSRGGSEIHIRGLNITGASSYDVKFGNTSVAGLWDSGRDALVTRAPPLRPGVVLVRISRNRQQYRAVCGLFIVNYATRVHVSSPKFGKGAERGSPITIHYAAFRTTGKFVRRQVQVTGVSVVLDDGTGAERAMIFSNKYGRYGWLIVHEVPPKKNELSVIRFRVFYKNKIKFHCLTPSRVSDPGYYDDDNYQDGWTWQYLTKKEDPRWKDPQNSKDKDTPDKGAWLETAHSALKGGALWNSRKTIRVHLEGTGNCLKKTVRGRYLPGEGVVAFVAPPARCLTQRHKLQSGTVKVSLALNGVQYSSCAAQYTYDPRYQIEPPKSLHLRVVPEALMKANITFPFNLLGRRLFDRRIVFDLSEALGAARDRFVVRAAHPDTGVVVVDIIPSQLVADPTSADLKRGFNSLVGQYGSVLYDGIMLWALDPLFPEGRIRFIDGLPYVTGECSDSSKLTAPECKAKGECTGMGCTNINEKKSCQASSDIEGTECRWDSQDTWTENSNTLKKLRFGQCSDPAIKTKMACLAGGQCSEKRFKSRSACLNAYGGTCRFADRSFTPTAPIRTMEECVDVQQRNADGTGIPKPTNGVCSPPPDSKNPKMYAEFKNRVTCLVPSERDKMPKPKKVKDKSCAVKAGGTNDNCAAAKTSDACASASTAGGVTGAANVCEVVAGNVFTDVAKPQPPLKGVCSGPSTVAFKFDQFKTARECENPEERKPPIDFSGGSGGPVVEPECHCQQDPSVDYSKTKSGASFNCGQFKSKSLCEKPPTRGGKVKADITTSNELKGPRGKGGGSDDGTLGAKCIFRCDTVVHPANPGTDGAPNGGKTDNGPKGTFKANEPQVCGKDGFKAKTTDACDAHNRAKDPPECEEIPCMPCQKAGKPHLSCSSASADMHTRLNHPKKVKSIKCPNCGHVSSSAGAAKAHEAEFHPPGSPGAPGGPAGPGGPGGPGTWSPSGCSE